MSDIPYEVGALYSRLSNIHAVYGGQRQGGISTPAQAPFIFIFTGDAGAAHGYTDFWDDNDVFHYFGEGQNGPMTMTGGNRALARAEADNKRILLFRMLGKSKPYRYEGEFRTLGFYEMPDIPDTKGHLRTALVFRLAALDAIQSIEQAEDVSELDETQATSSQKTIEVRTKQNLFRRRLIGFEKECRLTGIRDLRFVRASHIKPWSKSNSAERTDGCNGLLLTPSADLLFDQGWITFSDHGKLIRSTHLTNDICNRIGLDLRNGRSCGAFNAKQRTYMDYHRSFIFEKRFVAEPYSPAPEL